MSVSRAAHSTRTYARTALSGASFWSEPNFQPLTATNPTLLLTPSATRQRDLIRQQNTITQTHNHTNTAIRITFHLQQDVETWDAVSDGVSSDGGGQGGSTLNCLDALNLLFVIFELCYFGVLLFECGRVREGGSVRRGRACKG